MTSYKKADPENFELNNGASIADIIVQIHYHRRKVQVHVPFWYMYHRLTLINTKSITLMFPL